MVKPSHVLYRCRVWIVMGFLLLFSIVTYNVFILSKLEGMDRIEKRLQSIEQRKQTTDAGLNAGNIGRDTGHYARPFHDTELSAGRSEPIDRIHARSPITMMEPMRMTATPHVCLHLPIYTLDATDHVLVSLWDRPQYVTYRPPLIVENNVRARYIKANWYMPGAHYIVISQRPTFSLQNAH